jgi:hypothetical protein
MDIAKNLPGLLGNLVRNREQVELNRKKVKQAISQLDEESLASIKQLLDKFEHVQSVTQFVTVFVQNEQLDKAAEEMDAAIAVVQTAMDDDKVAQQAQAQAAANEAARNAPLSSAGQTVASAPADQAAAGGSVSDAAPASA